MVADTLYVRQVRSETLSSEDTKIRYLCPLKATSIETVKPMAYLPIWLPAYFPVDLDASVSRLLKAAETHRRHRSHNSVNRLRSTIGASVKFMTSSMTALVLGLASASFIPCSDVKV